MERSDKTGLNKDQLKAAKLRDLIAYQEDSVVSRTLVDRKTGTLTLFAFSEGQGISEHTAPFDALVYVVEGECDVEVSGKTARLEEGDVVVMPAGEPHALRAPVSCKMMLVMIRS